MQRLVYVHVCEVVLERRRHLSDAVTTSPECTRYVLVLCCSGSRPPVCRFYGTQAAGGHPPTTERGMTGLCRIYINRRGLVPLLIETLICCTSF